MQNRYRKKQRSLFDTSVSDLDHDKFNYEYLEGGCFYLAEAIAQQLGWPIDLVTEDDGDGGDIVHAFVVDPETDLALDITGFKLRNLYLDNVDDVPSRLRGPREIRRFKTAGRFRRHILNMIRKYMGDVDEKDHDRKVSEAGEVFVNYLLPIISKRDT